MRDGGRAAGLNLVQVSEHVESCAAPSVVQLALRHHSQQSGLARVRTPHHCHADLYVVLVVRHLRNPACINSHIT